MTARCRRRVVLERLVEWAIAGASLTAVGAVFLIFAFVAREAFGLLTDLGALRSLFGRSGPTGEWIWQPVGSKPALDVMPLLVGSLKITATSMAIAAPLAIAAAIAAAEILPTRARRTVAPIVEMLAGVPSVVLGLLACWVVAPAFQSALHTTYAANTLVASTALAVAVAPVVFAVTLDGLLAVPRELREASFALGARRYQTALRVVLPAAAPAVFAALTLGFGRAVGETMIVLMSSGNAAILDLDPTSGARTITATIAAELGETEQRSQHWRVLFFLGLLLVTFTFALDLAGRAVARALARRRLGASAPTGRMRRRRIAEAT